MPKPQILILGVGRNTAVYVELAEILGYSIAGFYHYQNNRTAEVFCGYPIIGCNTELFQNDDLSIWNFALSMGDNSTRSKLSGEIRKRGGLIPKLVHPTASVSKFALLEEGVVVHSNATIQAHAHIHQDSVISFNSGITHDTIVERACYIAGSSIVGAYAHVFEEAFIGMASCVISGKVKTIGERALIGAGSVVTKDVDPYTIVSGNPARVVGRVERSLTD